MKPPDEQRLRGVLAREDADEGEDVEDGVEGERGEEDVPEERHGVHGAADEVNALSEGCEGREERPPVEGVVLEHDCGDYGDGVARGDDGACDEAVREEVEDADD